MTLWNAITTAMAEHDPHLKAALDKRQKRVETAPIDDRLHRIEVTLKDVIRYEEEENEHVLNLHRSLRDASMDLQRQVKELQRFAAESDAQMHALLVAQQNEISAIQAHLAAWSYERAG